MRPSASQFNIVLDSNFCRPVAPRDASKDRVLPAASRSIRSAAWFLLLLATLVSSPSAPPSALPASANLLPLAESNRVFIAEIEHRGLTLTRRGFPAVAAAIRTNAAGPLARYFAPGFRGETLLPEQGPGQENDVLKIHRVTSDGYSSQKPVAADANAFVQYLLGLRHRFGADARVE